MTDTLVMEEPVDQDVRICQVPECEETIDPSAHGRQKYCDAHKGPASNRPKAKKDAPPANINFNLSTKGSTRSTTEAKRQEAVTKGAASMIKTGAAGFALVGDLQCAAAMASGADSLAQALGELSKYQPWLATVFAPMGTATGQVGAWLAVAVAAAGIAIPVLAHHNMVSPSIAEKFAGVMTSVAAEQSTTDAAAA